MAKPVGRIHCRTGCIVIPYHDENATLRTPIVTFGLVAANVAAWILLQGAGADASPAECSRGFTTGC